MLDVTNVRSIDPRHGQRWALFAGCLIALAAVVGPADGIADRLFTAHMIQHEVLIAVAAPLIALGRPLFALLRAVPGARRIVVALGRWPVGEAAFRASRRPSLACLLHGAAIWVWHVPPLFDAALAHPAIHVLQHASFFGTGVLFWSAVMHPRRPRDLGRSILYLFITAVHTAVLGALLVVARSPWYGHYASGGSPFGLTPLADQQLAGLVMWIPAGFLYLVAALHTTRRWLGAAQVSVRRSERMHRAVSGAPSHAGALSPYGMRFGDEVFASPSPPPGSAAGSGQWYPGIERP